MSFLNYHHLRYFRAVAREGVLTRAAESLGVSQSALSVQLRRLEESLGHALFSRENKALVLTDAGRVVLDYAETIFHTGEELMDTLQHGALNRRQVLRIGAVATMSRNFQLEILRPLLDDPDIELVLRSGSLRDLLAQLEAHTIDAILSNLEVRRDAQTQWHCHRLAEQPVSLVGRRDVHARRKFRFPDDLRTIPVLVPSLESNIRAAFDLVMEQAGVRPIIAAEVDDMAMLRLLARNSRGLTLVPTVVVKDELKERLLVERYRFPQIKKVFYAILPRRHLPNRRLQELLTSSRPK
jgi:LysR family transcriptional activator of nhaA